MSFAASGDDRLHVDRGGRVQTLDRAARALTFAPDGTLFAGVERSVLRLAPGGGVSVFSGHRDTVTALAAGRRLASGDAEGAVRLWRDDGTIEQTFRAFTPGVQALVWSADESLLLVAPRSRALEAWRLSPPEAPLEDDVEVTARAFAPGRLLTGRRDGRVRVVDTSSGRASFLPGTHAGAVRVIASAPGSDGAFEVLSGGEDGQVLLHGGGASAAVLERVPALRVTAADVSPDRTRAAWAFNDGTLVLFALGPRQELRRVREHVVGALRFSPDSRTLAVGRDDRRAVLMDADDLSPRAAIEGLDAAVSSLAWASTDLAFGLSDGQVRLWSARERRVVRTFTQPADRVRALSISDDASSLAAGSDDGHVYLWDLASGALLADVPVDAGDLQAVAFERDHLCAAGTDGRLHRWKKSP